MKKTDFPAEGGRRSYFLRNLLNRLPDFSGVATGVPGLPRAGRGRPGFTALAGTAMGLRGVETPGLGEGPPGAAVGEAAWARPGFGTGFRLTFSA